MKKQSDDLLIQGGIQGTIYISGSPEAFQTLAFLARKAQDGDVPCGEFLEFHKVVASSLDIYFALRND